jgi:hypothetical protein
MCPRFFQPMGAPVSFEPVKNFGSGGGSSSSPAPRPSDDSIKQAKVAEAYKGSMVDTSPASVPADLVSDGMEGMSVNIPQTGKMQSDPNKYHENLRKAGLGDYAQQDQERAVKIEQESIILENKKMEQYTTTTRAALGLAQFGDLQGAVKTINKVHQKGEMVTGIKPIDKDNFIIYSEDNPGGMPVNALELDKTLAGAEKRLERYFPAQIRQVGNTGIVYQRHALTGEEKKIAEIDYGKASAQEAEKASPLRAQYIKQAQDYLDIGSAYARILATNKAGEESKDKRGISDISLVYNYMKVLDPTSTVREGEAASVRNSQGVPDQVRTLYNKLQTGDQLGAAQRQEILRTSEKIYEGTKSAHDSTIKPMFDKYADELNVRRETVTGNPDFTATIEKYRPTKGAQSTNGAYPKATEMKGSAESAWGSYEPDKYDYRLSGDGKIQRKAKK